MFSPAQPGAHAYARVGVPTGGIGASPHKLIAWLYEGARRAVPQARRHFQMCNVGPRGEAIEIVQSGLQASLNLDAGGEIAQRLNALYSHTARRLLEANTKQGEPMLIEVDSLLATLEEAWLGIAPEAGRSNGAQVRPGTGPLTR